LKKAGHDVPEGKNEPPEERALFCDNNGLFDQEFLVNVDDHLINHPNIELQGKNKLFPNFKKSYQYIQDEFHFAIKK